MKRTFRPAARLAALAILSLSAAGCATAPNAELAVARSAVDDAQAAAAPQYAPAEFQSAQAKRARAEDAMVRGNYKEARRTAEEAEVDARLAENKARNNKAQQAIAELRQGVRTLQQELERQPTTMPGAAGRRGLTAPEAGSSTPDTGESQ